MGNLTYTLVGNEDGTSVITVFISGQKPLMAQSDHPNFQKMVDGVMAGDESIVELFDVAATAAQKFERLSDRVTSAHGRLYLDGEEIDNALATQVVRFVAEGVDDWKPLVNFFENVQANPNEHSRTQLYDFLNAHDFTITDDGYIVGYKGVEDMKDGTFKSIHSGRAIVNGEVRNGRISQAVGDIVEMPRNEVHHDPSAACSTGLHIATYEFAQGYNQGALLEIHVNPRDVVSVPTDGGGEKVRVCRYKVVGTLDAPYTSALLDWENETDRDAWGDGEDEFCYDCGQELDGLGLCPDCDFPDVNDDQDELPFNDDSDEPAKIKDDSTSSNEYWMRRKTYDIAGSRTANGLDPVQAGDKFQDLDKRRNRVIVVTQVDDDTAHYETENGATGGTISVKRLLTPYRFKRV